MKRKLIQTALALLVASFLLTAPRAQQTTPASQSSEDRVALYQALLDLTNPWTVMCIAAHPDDEDGTSLIVMRRKYGAHTVSLFSTFGEGGQNAIGPELYEEMGAIRARETMAAAEIQGSEPHFLGLKDFGFSKSADEAFKFWGHDEALRRMVLQIRKLRPDVIITNHNSTSGHGHHQATGRLELEAFDAAADPKRFPEQLKDGLTTWQVQRLFLRVGFGNQLPEQNGGTVTIDPNERDPIRGTLFAEEALRALQKHATQGPWPKTFADLLRFRSSEDGKLALIRYRLAREAKGAEALPKDSHNFVDGLRLSEGFAKELEMPTIEGRPLVDFTADRRRVLEQLIKYVPGRYRFTSDWSNYERLSLMRARIESATTVAAGLRLQVGTADTIATPNSTVNLKIRISNAGTQSVFFFGCTSEVPSLRDPIDPSKVASGAYSGFRPYPPEMTSGSVLEQTAEIQIPAKAAVNIPISSHLYEPSGLGLQVITRCSVGVNPGLFSSFGLEQKTQLDVAPAVEITKITPHAVIGSTRNASRYFTLEVTNHQANEFRGRVIPRVFSPCESIACKEAAFEGNIILDLHRNAGETLRLAPGQSVTVKPSVPLINSNIGSANPTRRSTIRFPYQLVFRTQRLSTNSSWETIGESVPVVVSYTDARVAPSLRVGYIRGFDFSLPNALNALRVKSKELSVAEVKTSDLQKYTSIIVDNRVYESQPELIAANQKLLDYAKDGGTLIVFYHKSNEWNPDPRRNRPELAPYRLILGDERITDETAPITFIEPEHPLLNFPNKMGQEDFANWIQERGLYYPKEWDPQYQALLQSNDPGEAPLKGGLLVADYGRGRYIYTSMVWYRELRGGVPGAYRMLANMISYGQAEGKSKK